jgi:hypothetical protein
MNVNGGLSRGEGEKEGYWRVKRIEVAFIYIYRQHNESHQTLFEKGMGRRVEEMQI